MKRDDGHADLENDIRIGKASTLTFSDTRGRPTQLQPRHYLNGANDRDFKIWDERGTANYITGGSNWTMESRFGYHLTGMHRFSAVNPKLQNPYTMQFTLGCQHEITPGLALESAVVGNRGVKFLMQRWMNEPSRITGLRPYPLLNVNYYVDESQQTFYASWQTSLRKRFSHGLSGSLHYTWDKTSIPAPIAARAPATSRTT